jgi:hypothetical protein
VRGLPGDLRFMERVRIPRGGRSRVGLLSAIIRALGSLAPAEGERVGVRGLPGELRFMERGTGVFAGLSSMNICVHLRHLRLETSEFGLWTTAEGTTGLRD